VLPAHQQQLPWLHLTPGQGQQQGHPHPARAICGVVGGGVVVEGGGVQGGGDGEGAGLSIDRESDSLTAGAWVRTQVVLEVHTCLCNTMTPFKFQSGV
jgi:hypothetical protein